MAKKKGITCYFEPDRKRQLELLARLANLPQGEIIERAVCAMLDKNAVAIKYAADALDGLKLDVD